jgi:Kef-type K+ transport system membrane component KefB
VGVLAGPDALGLVIVTEFIETLSQISIAVLLFLVGLKLDVSLCATLARWRWPPASDRSGSPPPSAS